jgi:hypothetical protein
MQELPPGSGATRSSFVTVIAWIFIVISGFMTFISLLQNILINTVFPFDKIQIARASAPPMPPIFDFMFDYFRIFFLAFLLVSAVKLVSAIGLLRRWNWARLVFVGILALGVVSSIGGLLLQQVMFDSMMKFPTDAGRPMPPDFEANMRGMMIAMRAFSAVFILGFAVLYAWIIKRLLSPSVAAEFR